MYLTTFLFSKYSMEELTGILFNIVKIVLNITMSQAYEINL